MKPHRQERSPTSTTAATRAGSSKKSIGRVGVQRPPSGTASTRSSSPMAATTRSRYSSRCARQGSENAPRAARAPTHACRCEVRNDRKGRLGRGRRGPKRRTSASSPSRAQVEAVTEIGDGVELTGVRCANCGRERSERWRTVGPPTPCLGCGDTHLHLTVGMRATISFAAQAAATLVINRRPGGSHAGRR
jgi:hypothetical protein